MKTFKPVNGGREYVEYPTNDGRLRKLLVPSREQRANCGILTKKELERLKNEARILTTEEQNALIEEANKKKEKEKEESQQRKLHLKKCQIIQKPKGDSKLVDVEREAKQKNLYLLERSYELMQEQDERVKEANKLILAAKCRAIRNAQIKEKELYEKQMKNEQKRLDLIMEKQCLEQIQREESKKKEEENKKHTYITQLTDQMKLNETEKLIAAEKKREETKLMNKLLVTMLKEDEEKELEKKKQQLELRDSLLKANEEMEKFKEQQKEADRIADLRVQAFMKKKAEEDEKREKRMALLKKQKEIEIARIRQTQQAQQDHQAMLNELNALRIQEETERKWREKELAIAKKKKDQIESLKREREKQIKEIRLEKAVRLTKDEMDFKEVTRLQKLALKKEQEEKAKRKQEAYANCRDLLRQINEKETEKIKEQQERFNERYLQQLEQENNDRRVEDYLKKKMNKLKENNVLAEYLTDIENQLKLKMKN